MIKRVLYSAVLFIVALSCIREEDHGVYAGDAPIVDLVIPFNAPASPDIEIGTKSTLGIDAESKIWNLYIFIFDNSDANKKKVYGKFFDDTNLNSEAASDWWTVTNSTTLSTETNGTIHLRTAGISSALIYGIANINADMVNISPEKLASVQKLSDLQDMVATLNQTITSRNGYFPMSGTLVNQSGYRQTPNLALTINENLFLRLRRLDAKVIVNVKVANPNWGYVQRSGESQPTWHTDLTDAEVSDGYGCKISEFIPGKWQVVNIPKKTWVIEHPDSDDASSDTEDFFNSIPTTFEPGKRQDVNPKPTYSGSTLNEILIHSFSFYMMENRRSAPTPAGGWTYQKRDRQVKIPAGTGVYNNGDFEFAPLLGTYVVFHGRVIMDNFSFTDTDDSGNPRQVVGATLNAEPTYMIHLGDFTSNMGNFDILRNHTYTYNITIFDVDDIRTEVEINYDNTPGVDKLAENEPGATGNVTVSLEEIFTCDCHYSSQVILFHADNIKADNVTWYVKTPFNPDGARPDHYVDGNGVTHDILTGIDYDWVEFRVNQKHNYNPETGTFQYWESERQIYKPRGWIDPSTGLQLPEEQRTMNVSELVEFLKKQKYLYLNGGIAASVFDNPGELDDKGPRIAVTAFVNEYYYTKDPINQSYSPTLWKRFVNQPMREMHILSDTKISADQESSEIGASFTIQQKSIQTIYNVDNPEVLSAWGSEHHDDPMESNSGPNGDSGKNKYGSTQYSPGDVLNGVKRGNTSMTNGRLNTALEWGFYPTKKNKPSTQAIYGFADKTANDNVPWSQFMNLTANNETPLMNGAGAVEGFPNGFQALRYSCMSRNRDNNGNGFIDQDELRWYMGATNQIYGLYLGDYGIEGDAKLYQRNATEQASSDAWKWTQHVLTSTMNYESNESDGKAVSGSGKKGPRCIWAEEGVTGSDMARSAQYNEKITRFTTRCLRNLGYDANSPNSEEYRKDFTYSPLENEPQLYINATRKIKELNGSEYVDYPYDDANQSVNPYNTAKVYYEFDCTWMNAASRRYFSTMELECCNEFDEGSMLPDFLRMAAIDDNPISAEDLTVDVVNTYLNDHIGDNPYCPPGFRLPNIRELVLIRYFLPENKDTVEKTIWKTSSQVCGYARNYWSFGVKGSYKRGSSDAGVWGWAVNNEKIQMAHTSNQKARQIRCVKDYDPTNPEDKY